MKIRMKVNAGSGTSVVTCIHLAVLFRILTVLLFCLENAKVYYYRRRLDSTAMPIL